MTHDPRQEIEKLRDHLVSHDKPIVFLVGAAPRPRFALETKRLFQRSAPLARGLRSAVKALGSPYAEAYATLVETLSSEKTSSGRETLQTCSPAFANGLPRWGSPTLLAELREHSFKRLKGQSASGSPRPPAPPRSRFLTSCRIMRWHVGSPVSIARAPSSSSRPTTTRCWSERWKTSVSPSSTGSWAVVIRSFRQRVSCMRMLPLADGGQDCGRFTGQSTGRGNTARDGARRIVRGTENARGGLILPSI